MTTANDPYDMAEWAATAWRERSGRPAAMAPRHTPRAPTGGLRRFVRAVEAASQ